MDEDNIGEMVLGHAIKAPIALGPGLLENAYEACLAHELAQAGLSYQRQIGLPVVYDGQKIDVGYRLDLLVERRMVVEVKAVDKLAEMTSASSAILRDVPGRLIFKRTPSLAQKSGAARIFKLRQYPSFQIFDREIIPG